MLVEIKSPVTQRLAALLAEMHDDGQPPLRVVDLGEAVEVLRADGGALSVSESRYVRAVLAAHAVEPIHGRPPAREREPRA